MQLTYSDNVTARANQFLRILFFVTIAVAIGMTLFAFAHPPAHAALSADFVFWGLLSLLSVGAAWMSYFLRRTQTPHMVSWQLLILCGIWGWAVLLLGGAMSSVNAIQLILVAFAFLVVPLPHSIGLLVFIFAFQFVYLYQLMADHSHHAQHDHFIGMSMSFLLAAIILAVVTYSLRMALERNKQKMAALREEQLRQEQVLAVATATAQISHELATPLNTLKLWLEELNEQNDTQLQQSLHPIRPSVEHMTTLLTELRETAHNIQHNKRTTTDVGHVEQTLKKMIVLQYPEHAVTWHLTEAQNRLAVDATLTSALLNLIRNAIQHQQGLGEANEPVHVHSALTDTHWLLTIRNRFSGEQSQLHTLGLTVQPSEHGLGIGTLLSHATLERFHGRLRVSAQEGTIEQYVELPLQANHHE